MKRLLRKTTFFCSVIFFPGLLSAAHIIGGEITYECLGYTNNDPSTNSRTYQFYMKIYRDCQGGGADFDSAPFGAFTASVTIFQGNTEYTTVFLSAPQETFVPPPENPCVEIPSNVCVEEGLYIFDPIDLPIVNESYFITYQRCCRNNSITNLINPGGSGATYFMELTPEAQELCNNSPTFNDFPPIVICAGEEFNFDHSATDIDGDQLVYEFCSPFLGGGPNTGGGSQGPNGVAPNPDLPPPYNFVNFVPVVYDPLNPLGNESDIEIDVVNGLITGTPNLQGQFVVGVCVYEYRNGVLLSTIRRDFQFNVSFCEPNVVADLSEDEIINDQFYIESCGENTINFINQSYQQSFIYVYRWEFEVGGEIVTLSDWSPSYEFPGEGQYTGRLILNPNTDCGDTANIIVNIFPEIEADFEFEYDTCVAGPVLFTDHSFSGTGNITNWSWDFGDFNGSSNPSPSHTYKEPGLHPVTLRVTDINGCVDIKQQQVSYFPVPDLIIISPSEFTGCVPAAITFNNLSSPVDETYDVIWDFGDGGSVNEVSPTYIYEKDGIFTVGVEITSPIGCMTDTVFPNLIEIEPSPVADFVFSPENPDNFNPEVIFTDQSSGANRWYWNFANEATSIEQNPSHSFRDTGLQEVILVVTHPSGCQDSSIQIVDVEPKTTFFYPNAFTPNNDSVNDTFKGKGYLEGIKSFDMQIWNRWGELIFRTNDPMGYWNGLKHNNGRMAPPGTYVLRIAYIGPRGQKNEFQGFITLIR